MLKRLKLTALVLCSFLLIGCSQSTSDDQKNNYEFRIMEDPSSGVLVTFYEKDENCIINRLQMHIKVDLICVSVMMDGQLSHHQVMI